MKVTCRKIFSVTTGEDLGDTSPWLTLGKSYVVLAVKFTLSEGVFVLIISDNFSTPIFRNLLGFEVVSNLMAPSWEIKDYKGTTYMMPKSWMYDTFLNEVEDNVHDAMQLFYLESKKMSHQEGFVFRWENEH